MAPVVSARTLPSILSYAKLTTERRYKTTITQPPPQHQHSKHKNRSHFQVSADSILPVRGGRPRSPRIFAETPYIYRERCKLSPPTVNQKAINAFYAALYAPSTRRDLFVSLFSEFASLAHGAGLREFFEMPGATKFEFS